MALLTLDYLAAAMGGVSFSDEDAGRAQYFIDTVSSYIENYTGTTFSPTVDEVIRLRSDSYGCIVLSQHPCTDVSKVHDFRDNFDLVSGANYLWDGLQTISGLRTRRVYDITFSYGYDPCPLSVTTVACKAVMRGINGDVTNLKTLTVGDITETYGDMLDFSDADMVVLDNYTDKMTTLRLDASVDSAPFYTDRGVILNGPDWWYDWDE
jgi:hypothetical protein